MLTDGHTHSKKAFNLNESHALAMHMELYVKVSTVPSLIRLQFLKSFYMEII